MIGAAFFQDTNPLLSHFLVTGGEKRQIKSGTWGTRGQTCPRYYGKLEGKVKVYYALKDEMNPELRAQWGAIRCHCNFISKMRLSKQLET